MPPLKRSKIAGKNPLVVFGGILTTEFIEPPQPGRTFCFRQTYQPTDNPSQWDDETRDLLERGIKPAGPPPHLHRFSAEYFKVEQGVMGLLLDGKVVKCTPEDPELVVPANTFHGFFRHPDSTGPMVVVLSGTSPTRDYQLDRVFFENWYGFWHDSIMQRGKLGYIEQVQLYDAGDAYLPVPSWVPFRETSSYLWGILVGRYIGTFLGYRPFHQEYTTDWDHALAKMGGGSRPQLTKVDSETSGNAV